MREIPKLLAEKIDHLPSHIATWVRGLWADVVSHAVDDEDAKIGIGRLTGLVEYMETTQQHRRDLQAKNSELHFQNGELREKQRAAEATLEDEQAAHQDTLGLLHRQKPDAPDPRTEAEKDYDFDRLGGR